MDKIFPYFSCPFPALLRTIVAPSAQTLLQFYNKLILLLICFLHIARVGPSVPRQDRPVREGTRVASIETGLAAAAAKLSQQVRLHAR